jgi:7,8-dihydro-6-hydroxymethylpterin-pyrophosphokinase
MTERRFVLQPLLDVWPDVALPDGTEVATFLPFVADQKVTLVAAEWIESSPG